MMIMPQLANSRGHRLVIRSAAAYPRETLRRILPASVDGFERFPHRLSRFCYFGGGVRRCTHGDLEAFPLFTQTMAFGYGYSSILIHPVSLALTPILPATVPVVTPSQPRSRMNAVIPRVPWLESVLAKTNIWLATLARVTQVFLLVKI